MRWITKTLALSVPAGTIVSILVLVGLSVFGSGPHTTLADDADGVITGIDMDITGNTATSLGSLDADTDRCQEVSAGDVIDIDVWMDDMEAGPPNNDESILGAGYYLGGWPASGNDATVPRISARNHVMLLNAGVGSMLIDLSEAAPDGDDPYEANIADFGGAEYVSAGFTQGVIGRYTLDTTGAAAGVYGLTLGSVVLGRDVPPGGSLINQAIWDSNFTPKFGLLAVDDECPGVGPTEADLKIVSQEILTPPQDILVSEDVQITLRKVIHNNGPVESVDVSIATDAAAPADCTATPIDVPDTVPNVPLSQDIVVDEIWSIHCTGPSTHTLTFDNVIDVVTPDVTDPNPGNNTASTELTLDATAQADVKVVGVEVSGPAEIDVSETATATITLTLHNDGPYGPVTVTAPALNVVPPTDCTAELLPCVRQVELPVSVPLGVDCDVEIHCSKPSSHTFQVEGLATEPKEAHVSDPNQGNNSGSTDYTVVAIGQADVKITGQSLVGVPGSIDVSESVPVTLRKTLHNNGGYGPVDVSIEASAVAPADCTADPGAANPTSANLPVSASAEVDEVWTIHCTAPSEHQFQFNNAISVTTEHVVDPDLKDNDLSTDLFLPVAGQADVKITGQQWLADDCSSPAPSEIAVNTDVDFCLQKTLHNNGPYGPVEVDITSVASAVPVGCIISPDPTNPVAANLPLSLAQTVDEIWTVNCDNPTSKTFTVDNLIAVGTVHVTDPNPDNNTASTDLNVDVVAAADLKVNSFTATDDDIPGISGSQVIVVPGVAEDVHTAFTIHNNGPYGPAAYVIEISVLDVDADGDTIDDCDVEPDGIPAVTPAGILDVSIMEGSSNTWSANWINPTKPPYSCTLIFTSNIIVTSSSVTDPIPGNNGLGDGVTLVRDTDGDNVPDDGDLSGDNADNPCETGETTLCDDNCQDDPNADQTDSDGDGIGDACEPAAPQADVKVLDNVCSLPADTIDVSSDVPLECAVLVHNNGPDGPVEAEVTMDVVAPPDCTVTPSSVSMPVVLDVSVDRVAELPAMTVHCSEPSDHELQYTSTVSVTEPDVVDPNPANNGLGPTPLPFAAIAKADLKVASVQVSGPAEIAVSETAMTTVTLTLHNNGSYGPVTVLAPALNIVPPNDCTAEPALCLREVELPVSLSQTADCNVEIHCSKPSSHIFHVEGFVTEPDEPHVVDPNPDNNSGSADYTVVAVAEADVKAMDIVLLDPPDMVHASESVDVTVRTSLHNNGPYGPVSVDVAHTADASMDCEVTTVDPLQLQVDLPVSTTIVVDHRWTIHCMQPSTHILSFATEILQIKEPHVVDPDPGNNSGSTELSLDVVGETDVKIVEQSLIGLPPEIETNTDVEVTLRKTLHNNGPYGPTWVSIDAFATAPLGCTATPDPGNQTSADLPVSVGVEVDEIWKINCSETGDKTFVFDNSIEQQEVHVYDPDDTNNAASTSVTVAVVPPAEKQADVKVVGMSVLDPPESIPVSESVDLRVRTTLHNNGPYGPVSVEPSYHLDGFPPDCDVATVGPLQVSLPVSLDVNDDHVWTIHCHAPSTHLFLFQTDIVHIKDPHVIDPNPDNNSGWVEVLIDAIAEADVKVVGMSVLDPPADIPVSEDVDVIVRTTLHNNGPYGPVSVEPYYRFDGFPPDCDVATVSTFDLSLPVSLDVNDDHYWLIHCNAPSTHTFTFQTDIADIKDPHVVDPNPGNNSGSVELVLNAIAEADVKITMQGMLDPPPEIDAHEDVDVKLRKSLHNNGPYADPVQVSVSTSVDVSEAPFCTASLVPMKMMADLPMSVSVLFDETWTIHCYEPGEKTFRFDNSIDILDEHVVDPVLVNNSTSTDWTVTATAPPIPIDYAITKFKPQLVKFRNPPYFRVVNYHVKVENLGEMDGGYDNGYAATNANGNANYVAHVTLDIEVVNPGCLEPWVFPEHGYLVKLKPGDKKVRKFMVVFWPCRKTSFEVDYRVTAMVSGPGDMNPDNDTMEGIVNVLRRPGHCWWGWCWW